MTMRFAPNQLVAEHLTLLRPIGEGGMGSVWLAFNAVRNCEVAVKFLSDRFTSDDMARARFFREARLGSSVRSSHVAEVLECALLSDGTPYIEMEFVDGEELSSRIKRKGALSIAETRSVVAQVSEALLALHAVGIVHRDVKPNNIVVNESNGQIVAKLVDLGIAKESDGADDLTQTGTTMGTPIYMSPEQMFDSRDAGKGADLWALAIVAYECLTGVLPFTGDTFGAVCIAVHSGRYKRPTELRTELATSTDEWFARAFARDKESRIDSIQTLRDSFASMCTARPMSKLSLQVHSLAHAADVDAIETPELQSPPSSPLALGRALGRALRSRQAESRVTVLEARRREGASSRREQTGTRASRVSPVVDHASDPSPRAVEPHLAKHHDVAFLVSNVRGDDPAASLENAAVQVRDPLHSPVRWLNAQRLRHRPTESPPLQEPRAA